MSRARIAGEKAKETTTRKREQIALPTPCLARVSWGLNSNEPMTTEIYADEAFFDSTKNMGIFSGRVKVTDPRFNLQSDKLTVFITKGENQGLEKAIAEGNVGLVRNRPDPNGGPPTRAVGRADKATYTAATGDVELRGTPRVQEGANMHVATSPDTVMIINQNSQLTTHGPSRTEIRQESKEDQAKEKKREAKKGRSSSRAISVRARSTPADTMISQTAPVSIPKRSSAAAPKVETVLTTDQLVKIYGGRAVVDGMNMNVRASEIVGLLGPNGAGKTTSFYMIVGLVRPNSGRVIFCDTDVTDYPMYKRARLGMGYLPQEESIFRKMTVEQNIMAILETLALSKAERRNRCDQLLHQFGIERIAKNTALTLSGGEKRRLTIARSLVTEPKLLMLDEPFSGVDPIAVYDVQQIIVNLRKSGLAIMITDHNVRETLSIVDRAYLIFDGRVESEGTKDFLINDPISRQLYLGRTLQDVNFLDCDLRNCSFGSI